MELLETMVKPLGQLQEKHHGQSGNDNFISHFTSANVYGGYRKAVDEDKANMSWAANQLTKYSHLLYSNTHCLHITCKYNFHLLLIT